MLTNPIQYTSRTFATVLADINADPLLVDKPDWWKRMLAGIMDVMSNIENGTANQGFLRTAFTRQAVRDLAALLDYNPAGRIESSGTLMFDLDPALSLPATIPTASLIGVSPGTIAVPQKRFESRTDLNAVASTEVEPFGNWNTNGNITVTNVYTTGEKIRLTTGGTLPTGLAAGTDYFVIYVNTTTIRIATTRVLALAGTFLTWASSGSGNHTITRLSRAVTSYQQTSVPSYSIGKSDGMSAWQEFQIAQVGVLPATLAIVVNGVGWTRVDTFVDSGPADKVFKIRFNGDDTSVISFGNGTYGEIPGAFDVNASYAFGGGADSNVSTVGSVASYGGSDSRIKGVYNSTPMTGGADAESITTTKNVAPMLLKARDRFVTIEDGKALAQNFGGLYQVAVNPNVYGILSCQVVGIANGGGNPSPSLRTALQAYLAARTVLTSVDVHVDAATITAYAVTSAAKMKPGFLWANVQPYFTLAWRLFLTETGLQIQRAYEDLGIAAAVTLINTIFSTSFVATDYTQIRKLLDVIQPRNFADNIQASDPFGYIQGYVDGIDYMTIALPSFPITCAADEITTVGALTLTEIP